MNIRYRFRKLGSHYHVRVFTGNAPTTSHACSGELVFGEDEWEPLQHLLRHCVAFIEDDTATFSVPTDDKQTTVSLLKQAILNYLDHPGCNNPARATAMAKLRWAAEQA